MYTSRPTPPKPTSSSTPRCAAPLACRCPILNSPPPAVLFITRRFPPITTSDTPPRPRERPRRRRCRVRTPRRDRYEHHGACDANRSRFHVFLARRRRAARAGRVAVARARVGGIGFSRSRAWIVEARIASRAGRCAGLGARVSAMRGGVFVAAFCAVRARDAASRAVVRARVGDRGLWWRQRIAHSEHCMGVLAVVRPWVGAFAGFE